MSIEAVAASAVAKEIAGSTAVEAAAQLAEKMGMNPADGISHLQPEQMYMHDDLKVGELNAPECENADVYEANEKEAAEELKNKLEDINPDCLDDNGKIYKTADGNLLPNNEYTANGNEYKTDDQARPYYCKYEAKFSPENIRDKGAQLEAGKMGGAGYDGAHYVGRELGGAPGIENLTSMRDTINRGEYRTLEGQERRWLGEGCKVDGEIHAEFIGESKNPSFVEKNVNVDGIRRVDLRIDNTRGSTAILDSIESAISKENFSNLKNEIKEMQIDLGNDNVSITSIRKDYSPNGEVKQITVGIRDEVSCEKIYRKFEV